MRTLILIAGLVLASATAQAGDNRSLSLAGSDAQTVTAPAQSTAPAASQIAEGPKGTEVPQAAEAPRAEAPKYVERPAIGETKPGRYKDEPRYRDEPRYTDSRRPYGDASRYDRPRKKRYWTERRIINALHRHGIYW
jgi:hypothetical protein